MHRSFALLAATLCLSVGAGAQTGSKADTQTDPAAEVQPGVVTSTRTEPALPGLTRLNADSIVLKLTATRTLRLHDFDFNGEPVDTAKIHLRALSPGVYELTSLAYTSGFWRVHVADTNSSIYGLGERSDTLDHAHTIVRNLALAVGAESSKGSSTSRPVPFFLSTAGYGLWLDAPEATFDFNASSPADIILDSSSARLRLLLFLGDATAPGRFPAILGQFTHLQPAAPLPSNAAFTAKSQAGTFLTPGDFTPGFAPGSGLPAAITAALSAGMSGMPLWSAATLTAPDAAVQARLCQFAAFTFNPPSALLDQPACSRYQALSAAFAAYRYASAQTALAEGQPLMQALALGYQDDARARQIKDEYLFGPSLLVAPVTDENTSRVVYLPAGEWVNLFTREAYTGPRTILAQAPPDTIPVYARKDAVLPDVPSQTAE